MQKTLSSKQTSELQSNTRKTEWLWKGLFFPSIFWGDWAFLCADTVILVLFLCLHRARRTLTKRRNIFEQCSKLQFMAACNDQSIYDHISNVGRTSTYISPRIQNDLLDTMGASLEKSIAAEVKEAQFFCYLPMK